MADAFTPGNVGRYRRCPGRPGRCDRARRVTFAVILALSLPLGRAAAAATITVDSAADAIAANGAVTLREAITSINNGADVNADVAAKRSGGYGAGDAIAFAIGTGAQAIHPAAQLPVLLKDVVVDATTQPGYAGSPLIALDGSAAGNAGGLLISSQTATTVSGLAVHGFAVVGLRIGTALDRIFADDFEPALAGQTALATALPQVGGSVVLNGVDLSGNSGIGLELDAGATLTATQLVVNGNGAAGVLVAGGRADIGADSEINFNGGVASVAPLAFGIRVAPGAVLTLTGTQATPIQVDANAGVGLLSQGNFSGTYVELANNCIQGAWIDTIDAPAFPDGGPYSRNAVLAGFDIHGNGGCPGSFPGGGITVLRTRASTTSMNLFNDVYVPERFVLGPGPAPGSVSRVHDNSGDGITLGGSAASLCAFLPAGLSCGAVDGIVENSVVYGNQEGIVVQQQNADDAGTVPVLFRNFISENAGTGLHVRTSFVGMDNQNAQSINGNTIGHNAWPTPDCSILVSETAPQVWFDGPVAARAEVVAACSAHASAAECNLDRGHTCLWNEDIFNANLPQPCRPSYIMSTNNCSSNANVISGYSGFGNPDLVVGVLAFDGAWVNGINVSWIHGGNLMQGKDYSVEGQTSFFSDGPANAEQTCTAAIFQCPVHF